MTDTKTIWDVKAHRHNDNLRIQLVEKLLDRMSKEELRSRLHQYEYLALAGMDEVQLRLEANKVGVSLDEIK